MTTQGQGPTRPERRIVVHFGEHQLFAYRAEATVAERYMKAMGRNFPGLRVTVDDSLTPELRGLPSEMLWSIAP